MPRCRAHSLTGTTVRAHFRIFLAAVLAAASFGAAAQVVLYDGIDLRGRKLTIRTDEPNLADSDFNDRAASMLVRGGPWQICVDPISAATARSCNPASTGTSTGASRARSRRCGRWVARRVKRAPTRRPLPRRRSLPSPRFRPPAASGRWGRAPAAKSPVSRDSRRIARADRSGPTPRERGGIAPFSRVANANSMR